MSQLRKLPLNNLFLPGLLLTAAIAGNYFCLSLFYRIDFLFGSVASLIALRLLGLRWGVAVAFTSSIVTYVLWNHPYAIIVFTVEILFVGILNRRMGANLLILDALYWGFLGMPLVWLFYSVAMGMDATSTTVVMLKQSVNGVFNALLANLLLTYVPAIWQRRHFSVSLSRALFDLVATVVFLPPLVFMLIDGQTELTRRETAIHQRLQGIATGLQLNLKTWYTTLHHGVVELAATAAKTPLTPTEQLQLETSLIQRALPDFHNMYVADENGRSVAFSPRFNEFGQSGIGLDFSNRPYFEQLRRTRKPVLSEVFVGRGGVFEPIVVLGVPIVQAHRFRGYAMGALDLSHVHRLLHEHSRQNIEITLLDSTRHIIASTQAGAKPLEGAGMLLSNRTLISENLFLSGPSDASIPEMQRLSESYYLLERQVSADLPWQLLVLTPVAPYQELLYENYAKNLTVILLFAAAALVLAGILSSRVGNPLSRVARLTAGLPDRLSTATSIVWPHSPIQEIESLVHNIQGMAASLKTSFEKLQERTLELAQSNRELEREISDRKLIESTLREHEELLEKLVETAPGLIYLADAEGRLLMFNRICEEVTGYSREEVLGERIEELFQPENLSPGEKRRAMALKSSGFAPFESLWMTRDGERRLIEWRQSVLNAPSGQPYHLGIGIDITERRATEERAQQQDRLAAVGQMAAGIAHDFNNLLTVIIGCSSILKMREDIPPDGQRELDSILNQAQRAAQLTRQILDFSRKTIATREVMDLAPFLEESVLLLRRTLPENIQMESRVDVSPCFVNANPAQLQQVIANLVVNARDAMPNGGILTIQLETVQGLASGPDSLRNDQVLWAVLIIRDTGCGIPPDDLNRIFEPFFSTKRPGKGTGLGLSQVYGIVKQHNGDIEVDSSPGKGTTFRIFLPRSQTGLDEHRELGHDIRQGQSETVLVVEDEEGVRETITKMLKSLNYKVVSASNGKEALRLYHRRRKEIDVVLTDAVMPEMGGWELCAALQQSDPRVRIVMMSGYPLGEDHPFPLPEGIVGSLEKPVELHEMARLISDALNLNDSRN